jgi:hypothetical protein
VVRGHRRLVCIVIAAALAGCTLITGVGDLDPSLAIDGEPDATASTDGTTESSPQPDVVTVDAADAAPSTRLKDITFENGALVHAVTGGDRAVGDAGLAIITNDAGPPIDAGFDDSGDAIAPPPPPLAIAGQYSMRVTAAAFVEETFGPIDEVFVTARLRVDATVSTAVPVMRILPETGTNLIEIRLLPTLRLAAFQGAQIGTNTNPIEIGKPFRLGIYVKKGKNANGALEVRIAPDGMPFPAAFAQNANLDFERPDKLQIGLASASSAVTFDDVKIDSAILPPL